MPSQGKIFIAIFIIITPALFVLSFFVPYFYFQRPSLRALLFVIIGLGISAVLAATAFSLMKGLPDRINGEE